MRKEVPPGTTVAEVIVEAVAEATGRDPAELDPLGADIDTDAVNALFDGSPGAVPCTLTVEWAGCRVTADRDGVTATPLVGA